jgi:Tol biopolymer transport system component
VRVEGVGALAAIPVVSTRGDRLAYTQLLNDLNIWRLRIGARDEPDGPTLLVSSTLMDDSPSYSPDGRRIAFVSTRSGSYEIWVCDADGSNAVQLTQFSGPVTGTPRWSPDAKWITFDTRVEGNPDIFVVSAEGGQPRRLTTEASEDIVPSWSRDGRFLYFSSTRSGSLQVWKMPAEGGKARQITKRGGFEGYESPEGDFFYYQKTRNPTVPGIWRVPVEGGDETLVFDELGAGLWRSWTVTREGIYFVGGEPPRRGVIALYRFSDGKVSEVFKPQRDIFTGFLGLSVSPDGKSLLYTQADQVGRDIMLVENFR